MSSFKVDAQGLKQQLEDSKAATADALSQLKASKDTTTALKAENAKITSEAQAQLTLAEVGIVG